MAFTQARAIALINTALEFKTALDRVRNRADEVKSELKEGTITSDQAFQSLHNLIFNNDFLFDNLPLILSILTAEHAHFSRNVRRNAYEAERARARRAQQPSTRTYIQYSHPYETTQMNPITYRPPGMNSRGDLPPSHTKATSTSLNPPSKPLTPQELSQEEFDAAVAAAGGVFQPNTDLEAEEQALMKKEEALRNTFKTEEPQEKDHDDYYDQWKMRRPSEEE